MTTEYRANPTDRQQDVMEDAAFEGGIPVHGEQKTRVVIRAAGGAELANHGTTNPAVNFGKNAGVIMSWGDNSGKFMGDTQGKA